MLLQIFHMFAHLCFRFSFQRSFLSQRSNVSIAIHQEIGHWLSISIAIWNTLVHIDMRLWIVQIWHYFVTFDCVHRRRYSSGNCARLSGGPRLLWSLSTCVRMWIALFCRNGHIWLCIGYFGPFQPVASPARPSDQIPTGSWDTNGDLCCQFMTSKLLFLLPYTFHRTRNLIGKSLTGWNCLSWPMFFSTWAL